jgi:aryl-alcohol dehydrogenase-like predicted oxidoreductase
MAGSRQQKATDGDHASAAEARDGGVNYLDTAQTYHLGASEKLRC